MVEVLLGELGKIGPLGQELALEAVGVFIRSALPGRAGIAEPDVDLRSAGQLGVAGHFDALGAEPAPDLIRGQTLAQEGGQAFHLPGEALQSRRPVVLNLRKGDKAGLRSTKVPTEERLEMPLRKSSSCRLIVIQSP